jgi:ATP/maltotriose-dependent transcriptional regulator MalT/DNA-binding SARP family transcriptional activator
MDKRIFLEKVRRPDPRGLARDRLEQQLLAPDGPPIGLVVGPPGTGKTTLLSRVAAAATTRSNENGGIAAWYRATEDDGDEAGLVCHLAHAIGSALPDQAIVDAGDEGSVDVLVSALETLGNRPILLVVDDLHALAGTRAESALERFVALRPRTVRILLGSRRPPALNTSRLLVSGELCQLDSEDLRFRSWEVEELFRAVYRLPLSPETAAALTRRTGGWAAGLQLFHLGTAGLTRSEREQAVAELSGRSRLIRSYLTRNVLDGLDPIRRSFLLRTCTLGVLTAETCDALLGTTGSAAILDDLEQQQFFTTSTDGGLTFRYHQVLQTHLEVVLVDELGSQAAWELYSRSAQLLEASGRTAAAVRAHARADDWGAVARLLHQGSPSLPTDDDALWAAAGLPGTPNDDPGLVLVGARRLLRNGLVPEAVAAYKQAESLMDDPDFRQRCAEERVVAALWLPQPGDPRPQQEASRAIRLSRELRSVTQDVRQPALFSTGLARGAGYLLSGQPEQAARVLRQALAEPGLAHWELLAVRLATRLADLTTGPAEQAAGQLEEIVLSADVDGLPWMSRMARGLQAALLLAAQPMPWRFAACADLLEDCERHGDQWTLCLLAIGVGAAYAVAGRDENAIPPLLRAEEIAAELGAPVLQVWAAALRTAAATRSGDRQAQADAEAVAHWAIALGVIGAARILQPGALPAGSSLEEPAAPASTAPSAVSPSTASPAGPLSPGSPARGELESGTGEAAWAAIASNGAEPPRIRLSCLGGFGLTVDGRPIDPDTLRPRARALLAMLAMHHGHDVHRERLVDALWPESSLPSGIRSLQVAVSSIRHCLAAAGLSEECLRRRGDAYGLQLPAAQDQLREFERLGQRAGQLSRNGDRATALENALAALDLYGGELLPEVGPAEWVVEERDRLRTVAAGVGATAAELALEQGELAAGIEAAQRSIEIDPYHDHSWTLLAKLHERRGDRSAAAVTRREHARVHADLGLVDADSVGTPTHRG